MDEFTHYSIRKIHFLQELTKTFPILSAVRAHGFLWLFVLRNHVQGLPCCQKINKLKGFRLGSSGRQSGIMIYFWLSIWR